MRDPKNQNLDEELAEIITAEGLVASAAEAEEMAASAARGEGGFAPSQSMAQAGEALPDTEDGANSDDAPSFWGGAEL